MHEQTPAPVAVPAPQSSVTLLEPSLDLDLSQRDRFRERLRDFKFRARLRSDPAGALRSANVRLPQGAAIRRPFGDSEIEAVLGLDRYADEERKARGQVQKKDECAECPPPKQTDPPPKWVKSVIASFNVEKRGCGILPEGAKDNDGFMVPLPSGHLYGFGVDIAAQGGVFGGGAYVAGQHQAGVVVSDGKTTKETRNGALAVNVRWWFNGWSEVKYIMNVYVTADSEYPRVPGTVSGNLTAPECPINRDVVEAFRQIKCFMIVVSGETDANFSPSGVAAYPSPFCPTLPTIGPVYDLRCPKTGHQGEYICVPSLCGLARTIGLPWPGC